jgi:lipoprotein NlpD
VSAAAPLPPGSENAGKPGYYTVKPGDTLARIGLEAGQSYREIARWNGLDNPNRIEAGQVIRVVPPGQPDDAVVTKPVASGKIAAAPLPAAAASATPPARPVTPTPAATTSPAAPASDEDIAFIWPAKGEIVTGFDEAKNRKGVDVGGAAGDPVLAAADGEVVYAGAGLRGYGNLIILKHNKTYLSAYAHNQSLLVKEGSSVRQGQKIAEMGNSDADQVKLHFEVRKLGKPVDPTKYLPAR